MTEDNKAVMLSIRPPWCELIASGKKTVEVRKRRPKLETPFKVLIYQTKPKAIPFFCERLRKDGKEYTAELLEHSFGKVIGEFVCDEMYDMRNVAQEPTCITITEWLKYTEGHKGVVYGWHISDLRIYEKPKELNEFRLYNKKCKLFFDSPVRCFDCKCCNIKHPPQSWCYVREVKNMNKHDATEQAYKNGYEAGMKDIKDYLVEFITKGLNRSDKSKAYGYDAIDILGEIVMLMPNSYPCKKSQSGWISVGEHLPEPGALVLGYTGSITLPAVYQGENKWQTCFDCYTETKEGIFTHWMPRPEPPKY